MWQKIATVRCLEQEMAMSSTKAFFSSETASKDFLRNQLEFEWCQDEVSFGAFLLVARVDVDENTASALMNLSPPLPSPTIWN